MKVFYPVKWNTPDPWLGCIGVAIILFYLRWDATVFQAEQLMLSATSVILVWRRRSVLSFQASPEATGFAALFLMWNLVRRSLQPTGDILGTFSPVLVGLALAILASGFRGLGQYIKSLLCLFLSCFPVGILLRLPDVSLLDARFAHVILWYFGFDVVRDGTIVLLPKGGIHIFAGCSSIALILVLLKLIVSFYFLFQLTLAQTMKMIGLAIVTAFTVNAFRLCLLAILVAHQDWNNFEYFHSGNGVNLITTMVIVGFGIVNYQQLKANQQFL